MPNRNKIKTPSPKRSTRRQFPIPTREDYFDFLIRCYFGKGADFLHLGIDRAYLDFNRTLSGIADNLNASELHDEARKYLVKLFRELPGKK